MALAISATLDTSDHIAMAEPLVSSRRGAHAAACEFRDQSQRPLPSELQGSQLHVEPSVEAGTAVRLTSQAGTAS